ncbi:MAG: 2-C-methyl-D-erythritol 2,4-cyclodiphosphate synthase, partial [Pirellulales bacterium]
VDVPHDRHALGHSDADVLLHALTDALLGAAALGDIGELFPDTDPANRGRDSAEFVTAASAQVVAAGWSVANVDAIIHAERPKLTAHKGAIRQRIATLLGIDTNQVGIKAKTGERVGPVGREEAIAAQCVVLVQRSSHSQ